MEFKGTKGKWVAWLGDKQTTSSVKIGSMEIELEIDYDNKLDEERANALLISKAPEMLEMLKEIHSFLSSGTRINSDDIEQLIKEATEI